MENKKNKYLGISKECDLMFKITEIVALGLLQWIWADKCIDKQTGAIPTREYAVKEYFISPMFKKSVDSMVVAIIEEINYKQGTGNEYNRKRLERP